MLEEDYPRAEPREGADFLTLLDPISWASNPLVLGAFLGRPPRVLPTRVVVDEPYRYTVRSLPTRSRLKLPGTWLAEGERETVT